MTVSCWLSAVVSNCSVNTTSKLVVKIDGLGIMGHYTLNQTNNRYIGDIKIHNDEFNETYYGFENHQGRTFLADNQNRWARSSMAMATIRKTA